MQLWSGFPSSSWAAGALCVGMCVHAQAQLERLSASVHDAGLQVAGVTLAGVPDKYLMQVRAC